MKYGTVWNCMYKVMELHLQGHGSAFNLIELHARQVQAHEIACKLMVLQVSSWNCMQVHGLHGSFCN